MALFDGKKGLILGVANDRSIAWAIAREIMEQGGECGFTHLPDRPDDEKKKNRRRVANCIDDYPAAKFLVPMDVQNDEDIAAVMAKTAAELSRKSILPNSVMAKTAAEFGKIDFLLHSIAFATLEDLRRETIATSREGFKLAMEISAYSLLAVTNAARGILNDGSAVLTMTYFGGEKCIPGYNVMGVCKAALDAAMRYAAFDLGERGIRVNALSAGPLKTLASSAVGAKGMESLYENVSPLGRNITHVEVAKAGAFLLSDMSGGITGEIMHVDAGYNMMGSPGRLLDKLPTS